MTSLTALDLSGCQKLARVPESFASLTRLLQFSRAGCVSLMVGLDVGILTAHIYCNTLQARFAEKETEVDPLETASLSKAGCEGSH